MAHYTKPVVFRLGNESYGMDINRVASIETEIKVVPVPNVAPYIRGIMNLRGNVIPVFNLKQKFGMTGSAPGTAAVIVNMDTMTLAVEVDAVEEIHDIGRENIVDMPVLIKQQDTRYLDRVANDGGRLVVLLDIDQLITEEEKRQYSEIAQEFGKEK